MELISEYNEVHYHFFTIVQKGVEKQRKNQRKNMFYSGVPNNKLIS